MSLCSPTTHIPTITTHNVTKSAAHRPFNTIRAKAAALHGSTAMLNPAPLLLESLHDLPEHYDGVLLDQFGVLHDGQNPYSGAIQAVRHLADRGMRLLIISNSSRRSEGALSNLARMGFPLEAFSGVITSGEMTHQALLRRETEFWKARRRCLHLTWAARGGAISIQGLGLEITQNPLEADCILAHGTEALGSTLHGADPLPMSLEDIKKLLETVAAGTVPPAPMIVANPDIVTVHGAELRTMPGTLARWYRDMGGDVVLMGKPSGVIYEEALRLLGLPAEKVVAIGDSMEHDVAGAESVGVDCVFVAAGIHGEELGVNGKTDGRDDRQWWKSQRMKQLCETNGVSPRYVMKYFAL